MFTFTLASLALSLSGPLSVEAPAPREVDVIAFGSCAQEDAEQEIWDAIVAQGPDLFLFIGDNVYADIFEEDGERVMKPTPTPDIIERAYEDLDAQPGYQRLKGACPVLATWDDHDFGANDAGKEWHMKDIAQEMFLDFFGVAKDSPRREREGVYHAEIFGEPGRRVQVILTDTRYHRDPLARKPGWKRGDPGGPYTPHTSGEGDLLGEEQWEWLREQLLRPAEVRIFASSIQVVADEHGWECWGNFPHERDRLYRLIDETNAEGVVFISGDRHLVELSCNIERGAPYPMWDLTSSGFNWPEREPKDVNSYRVGPVLGVPNFGLIRIDWETPNGPMIALEGRGLEGEVLMTQYVWLKNLRE